MDDSENTNGGWVLKGAIIFILLLAYAGLATYFRLALHTSIVYTHFAYIPIVLASMWWGRKGALVAALLGGITVAFRFADTGPGDLWSDGVRILLFVAVAFCTGLLSERVTAAQNSLRVSEERYRLVIEKSLVGILLYRDDRIVFANSRMSQMLGYVPQSMVGISMWDLISKEDWPKVRELVEKRKAEGLSDLHYECRLVREDGKTIWADMASSIARYEGEPAVLVNAYDITETKEEEKKRRELSELARRQEEQLVHSTRLAELGEMAAAVAHELNQPLTGIRNFAKNALYMIQNDLGGFEDVKENLGLISEQVDRAAKIINRMRELTRKSEQQFAPVDVSRTLRETTEFLMPQFELSGINVSLALSESLPEIMGDRIRLEQVFLNILTNARQAMEESAERRLQIKAYFDTDNDWPVVVEIVDTGKGFAPEEAEKLFAPFFSTKKAGHGTGLGLSISLSIIKDHRGTIEAIGAPGKGATFRVKLPATAPETLKEDE